MSFIKTAVVAVALSTGLLVSGLAQAHRNCCPLPLPKAPKVRHRQRSSCIFPKT